MNSLPGLIARLERAEGSDRRLDAEVIAAVLGPPGCVLNPFRTPEGWDIELAPDETGESGYWMEAADVPLITSSLEDVCSVLGQARPGDGASILARALSACPPAMDGQTPAAYASRVARSVMAEMLRTAAIEQLRGLLSETRQPGPQDVAIAV